MSRYLNSVPPLITGNALYTSTQTSNLYLSSGSTGSSNITMSTNGIITSTISSTPTELSIISNSNIKLTNVDDITYIWPRNTPIVGQSMIVTDITNSIATLSCITPAAATTLSNLQDRLIVPLYIYPSGGGLTDYTSTGTAMSDLGGRVDVVINPNNGNDATSAPNSDWTTGLGNIETAAGASFSTSNIYGYTYTQYGARDVDTVKNVITGYFTEGWEAWVGNIFLDEVSSNPTFLSYYTELIGHVQSLGGTVILNSGVALYEELATLDGVSFVINKEGESSTLPTYLSENYQMIAPSRYKYGIILNSEASSAEVITLINLARSKNFGRFYVTDAANYNTISAYLAVMVTILKYN